MLGRYVTGTFLILAVAMVITPDTRERAGAASPQVTRAETATGVLTESRVAPQTVTIPVRALQPVAEASRPAGATVMQSSANDALIASAVRQALNTAPDDGDGTIVGIAALAGLESPSLIGSARVSSATYTDNSGASSPIAEPEPADGADLNMVMFVSGSRVNVRSGPSTSYGVINSVQYGDAVELVRYRLGGWAEIRLAGTDEIVFMSDRFLAESLNGG